MHSSRSIGDVSLLTYSSWAVLPSVMPFVADAVALRARGKTLPSDKRLRAAFGGAERPAPAKSAAVAVIPVHGLLLHRARYWGLSLEQLAHDVTQLAADAQISTIVLDAHSPGGTVAGTHEAWEALMAARASTKLIAVGNTMLASAMYWLASACHEIVVTPSAFECVGSIGVFEMHSDYSKNDEQMGITRTFIYSGKYKTEANMFEPLTDEARAAKQAQSDQAYEQFVADVAKGRGVSVKDVRTGFGEGRAVSAKDAKALGMIDRIDTLEGTLARLAGRRGRAAGAVASLEGGDEAPVPATEPADAAPTLTAAAPETDAVADLDLRQRRLRLRRRA